MDTRQAVTATRPVSAHGDVGRPERKSIASFRDLDVYQVTYTAMLRVARELLPTLPNHERYDLIDQLSRASKAAPRLIAEGYAKRHQKAGFQKYLDDAMAECNELIVSIEQCRDLYDVDPQLTHELVDLYDKAGRQLYRLSSAWSNFKTSPVTEHTKRAS